MDVFAQQIPNFDPLTPVLRLLNEGLYQDALREASILLDQDLPQISKASLRFIIGASNNELGNNEQAVMNFLEGYAIISRENEPAMMGHFQDELARLFFKSGKLNAALFFIDMAIPNFELAGNQEMSDSCFKFREELLGKF